MQQLVEANTSRLRLSSSGQGSQTQTCSKATAHAGYAMMMMITTSTPSLDRSRLVGHWFRTLKFLAAHAYMLISKTISDRCNGLFGHITRLADDVPAHKALSSQINLSLGRPPNRSSRSSS